MTDPRKLLLLLGCLSLAAFIALAAVPTMMAQDATPPADDPFATVNARATEFAGTATAAADPFATVNARVTDIAATSAAQPSATPTQTPEPVDPFATVNARVTAVASLTGEATQEAQPTETPAAPTGSMEIVPPSGPIGTVHGVTVTGLSPNTNYDLVVIFEETGQIVFSSSVTTNSDGFFSTNLITEPSDALGVYTVAMLQDGQSEAQATITITEDTPTAPAESLQLNPGETVTGTLSDDGFTGYTFEGQAGQIALLEMDSNDFDAFLVLLGPDGAEITRNDDGATGSNARITDLELPVSGEYTVIATSRDTAESGGAIRVSGEFSLRLDIARRVPSGRIAYGDYVTSPLTRGVQTAEYTFEGRAGDVISISLNADEFDPLVRLLSPGGSPLTIDDDSGPGLYAFINRYTLQSDGVFTIVVDGNRGFSGQRVIEGRYTLRLQNMSQQPAPAPTDTPATATPAPTPTPSQGGAVPPTGEGDGEAPTPIVYGDVVEGTLPVDVPVVEYSFSGTRGEIVTIALDSDDFDPLLRLRDANGTELIVDDDAGPGTNALITEYVLPRDGEYIIAVDAYRGPDGSRSASGDFTLTLMAGEAPPPVVETDGDTITPGQPITGSLDSDTQTAEFSFSGQAGDRVTITLDADDFDPLVRLRDADGDEIASDDDSGGSFNARIEDFALPADGVYTIVVDAFRGAASQQTVEGEYTLTLIIGDAVVTDPIPTPTPLPPVDGGPSRAITLGDSLGGELGPENQTVSFTFQGTAGEVVSIALSATDFDPLLRLIGPDGEELASDDDSGFGLDALISGFELPQTGTYTIVVDAFRGTDETREVGGAYSISLAAGVVPVEIPPIVATQPITSGETVTGSLGEDGVAAYTFEASAGTLAAILLESSEFDPILRLYGPDLRQLTFDDDGAGELNALITDFALPSDGTYTIVVDAFRSSTSHSSMGDFTLTLTLDGDAPVVSPDPTSVPGGVQTIAFDTAQTVTFTGVQDESYAFSFAAEAGDIITARAISGGSIDTLLGLFNADDEPITTDDDSGDGFDPELYRVVIEQAGTYTLMVMPHTARDRGTVELTVLRESPLALTDEGAVVRINEKFEGQTLTFSGEAGQVVRVTVESISEVSGLPVVTVRQGSDVVASNPIGQNLRLSFDFIVPESGDLAILVESSGEGAAVMRISAQPVDE